MIKNIFVGCLTLAILFCVVVYLSKNDTVNNDVNVDFIISHSYNGKVLDMENEVSVKGPDDIKWYYSKNDTITIEFGKILLKYELADFVTKEVQDKLNSINIFTKQNKESLLFTLYYFGDELIEYVKK